MFFLKFNVESGTTQTEVAEKVGVSLAYVNRITKGREQIVNTFSGKSDGKNLTFCINRSRILIENLALCQKCQETESLKFFLTGGDMSC